MEKHPLYGKRKKKIPKCPNPLFEQWIKEWREDAASKNMKTQYVYAKALKSLQKYPLPLPSGKDCKMLENFGDKMCKMLDDRLQRHIAQYGSALPVKNGDSSDSDDSITVVPARKSRPTGKGSNHRKSASAVGSHRNTTSTGSNHRNTISGGSSHGRTVSAESNHRNCDASNTSGSQDGEALTEPRRVSSVSVLHGKSHPVVHRRQRSSSGRGREYVPAYRSGAYALLLTLYRNLQKTDSRGYMTKAELVSEAQPLADTSFSMPDPGSRYTSWSSMGTLIKKGLVLKESSPARYSITDAGCELAHKLAAVQAPDGPVAMETCTSPARNIRIPSVPATGQSRPVSVQSSPGISVSSTANSDSNLLSSDFQFNYVTDVGEEMTEKQKAAVLIDDEIGVGFLVKCNYIKLLHSGKKYKIDTTRPMGTDVYVYLHDDDAPEFSMSFSNVPRLPSLPVDSDSDISDVTDRSTTQKPRTPVKKKSKTSEKTKKTVTNSYAASGSSVRLQRNTSSNTVYTSSSEDFLPEPSTSSTSEFNCQSSVGTVPSSSVGAVPSSSVGAVPSSSVGAVSSSSVGAVPQSSLIIMPHSSADSLPSSQTSSISSVSSLASLPAPDFTLRPGMFDIVLCVDNQEFYGSRQGGGKSLLPELIKNGVNCELRKLQVGDLVWVAQEKAARVPGQLEKPKGRELVLDFVIERKRMDDLVSSCIDGRLADQKLRLKQCGLRRPIFMIENYGSMQHFSIPEERIQQTITNLKVIDGFQVKRTKDIKESVAYLTVMTRYLQSYYQNKTLHACSPDDLQEFANTFDINDAEFRLQTFEQFSKGSVKTKNLTVREMFGKQLMQVCGVSADRAKAITDVYPTVSHLLSAYDNCTSVRDKENLLSTIKTNTRNLGAGPSKVIYQLYCTETALT